MSNLWRPDPYYANNPDHQLHNVPLMILRAARAKMRITAEIAGELDDVTLESIADGVVLAILPLIKEWLRDQAP